ncbi:hypothetical protein HDU82_001919, partial [Entophlyctis luteolus]
LVHVVAATQQRTSAHALGAVPNAIPPAPTLATAHAHAHAATTATESSAASVAPPLDKQL